MQQTVVPTRLDQLRNQNSDHVLRATNQFEWVIEVLKLMPKKHQISDNK